MKLSINIVRRRRNIAFYLIISINTKNIKFALMKLEKDLRKGYDCIISKERLLLYE